MANWYFNPNTVEEAPLAWVVPLDRYRMERGISIGEIEPNVFEAARFWSYTDENAIRNAGLRFYKGGYIWEVSDQDRDDLINGGVDVTAANFTPIS